MQTSRQLRRTTRDLGDGVGELLGQNLEVSRFEAVGGLHGADVDNYNHLKLLIKLDCAADVNCRSFCSAQVRVIPELFGRLPAPPRRLAQVERRRTVWNGPAHEATVGSYPAVTSALGDAMRLLLATARDGFMVYEDGALSLRPLPDQFQLAELG